MITAFITWQATCVTVNLLHDTVNDTFALIMK